MITTKQLIQLLKQKVTANMSPVWLADILAEIIIEHLNVTKEEAEKEVSIHLDKIKTELDKQLEIDRKSKTKSWFNFHDCISQIKGPFNSYGERDKAVIEENANMVVYFNHMK
jgi:hypothetical protein